ncbi:MAG: glycosyltransferase [Nitrospirae bacterium]|nr:glycosyltransferase [Nitrospirota bacterium]MBI3351910.1 glycosyltransferase [Nitrospirota bacterium]
MKISGATFGKNLIELDYPVVEAISSILPIVDEFVVNVGKSEDDTLKLIQSIKSPKIKIIESVWDDSLRKDGLIFSQQANIAISACKGDWIFYMNADEVIHEKELPAILKSVEKNQKKKEVLGLMFWYYHFDGDFWSVNPWKYRKEIRLIKNDGRVRPCGDMSGFEAVEDGVYLKGGPKNRWAFSGATVYHYGWVRKTPRIMQERNRRLAYFYDEKTMEKYRESDEYDYAYYEILKEFRGTHPKTMQSRISQARRLRPRTNRWLNWKFYREILKHGFKG